MTGKDVLNNFLFEERQVPAGKHYIAFFDIDDTMLVANNIKIWKKTKDGKEIGLTPAQYAVEKRIEEKAAGTVYDFKEFKDSKIVKESIVSGTPIVKNLKIMSDHFRNGWEIGILTARGMEDVVHTAIIEFLNNTKDVELIAASKSLQRNLVKAINDDTHAKIFAGMTDFQRKASVLNDCAKTYDKVKLCDDDEANIAAVRALKNPKIIAVRAWK